MLLEILCQKKSFQKHLQIYIFCFAWFCFCTFYHNIIPIKSWIAYGIPLFIVGINTVISLIVVIKIQRLIKTGRRITCRIVHSISDFNNGVLRIRCSSNLDEDDSIYQFEEKVMVPYIARSPKIDSIYKKGGNYFDMEYIEVLVNPINYNQYEILYCELLNDESRKGKYQLCVMGMLLLVFVIILTKIVKL